MAGVSDVQNQLVAQAAAIIYPNGTAQPSICGMPVKIYPGWPVPNVLENDLKAGKVHISVYPSATERKTTCHNGRGWKVITQPVHTVAMAVTGAVVTLSGTPSRQNLLLNVDGTSYSAALATRRNTWAHSRCASTTWLRLWQSRSSLERPTSAPYVSPTAPIPPQPRP